MTVSETRDDEYVVTIARHGTRSTLRSDVFLTYSQYHEPDGPIGMDYFVWIIRNAHRTIVVDTGFSRVGAASRSRDVLIEIPALFALLGVEPADSPSVVITHAHYDHIGNLSHFPASRIHLSRHEYEFWTGPNATKTLFHHSVEDDELDYLRAVVEEGRVDFFEGSRVIAPGVELIELGGHTPVRVWSRSPPRRVSCFSRATRFTTTKSSRSTCPSSRSPTSWECTRDSNASGGW
ncbi:MAG: MBL fold metallo-hydrolase [Galbitalea sp.]